MKPNEEIRGIDLEGGKVMKKILWVTLSLLMVVALVLTSCTPAAQEGSEGQTVTGKVTEKDTPEAKDPTKEEPGKEEPAKVDYSKPQYGGTYNGAIGADPTIFDVYRHDPVGLTVESWWAEGLLWADWTVDREVLPLMTSNFFIQYTRGCLLESWENPDPLTYIWHVRPGVRWQNIPPVNGRELVANDIVYTYHRQTGLGSGFTEPSPYAFYDNLMNIESIEETDKYTIVVKLKELNPEFPVYWGPQGLMRILAPEVIEEFGDFGDWRDVAIGTGPFILEDYVKGSALTFSANPTYWATDEKYPGNKLPYVDGASIAIIEDPSTRLAALRTGKLDLLYGIKGSQWDTLQNTNPELNGYITYGEAKNIGMNYWAEPFTDRRVRKALQMSIDLKTITEEYFKGYAYWFPSLAGPCMGTDIWTPLEEYPEEVQEGFIYNPEKAKALLAEAGYPNGFTTNVVTRGFGYIDLLEVAQAYFADIGVTLEIKAMEYTAGNATLYGRQHDQMYYLRAGGCWNAYDILLYWYSTTAWNWGDINDPHFDKIVEDVRVEPDPVKRSQMIKDGNVYGTSEFWGVFMPVEQVFNVAQPWVKGFQGEAHLGVYWNAAVMARIWIDQDMQQ